MPPDFVEPDRLREMLAETGFGIDGWYGDDAEGPVRPTSLEVIVVAVRL